MHVATGAIIYHIHVNNFSMSKHVVILVILSIMCGITQANLNKQIRKNTILLYAKAIQDQFLSAVDKVVSKKKEKS